MGALLVGRQEESARVQGVLEAARERNGGALIVTGEAGVGKTALVQERAGAAAGFQIARAAGAQLEMELPFATLQQLCAPMLELLPQLPPPQRQALEVAFGLRTESPTNRFLVGMAVLGLLCEAGRRQPLLCVVDDAQWMDKSSAQTLSFVARRLIADRVALVFTSRATTAELDGLPQLALDGLSVGASRKLLASVIPGPLDGAVRDRIILEARGNPLALLELPRSMTPVELAGGFGQPDAPALSGRIEQGFHRRLHRLPADAQCLVLIAAADPTGDPALLWQAGERLGVAPAAARAAEAEGLLRIGRHVVFRHPLVRAAVYRAASTQARGAVHQALGEATDPRADPDRRAWHLAQAASGTDEQLAFDLECSASRAQARGGYAAAGAFLERAASLTLDPRRRGERALAAARAMCQSGAFDTATELLSLAAAAPLGELPQARAALLHGQIAFARNYGRDAPPLLIKAARRLERLDEELARETYLDALAAALLAGRLGGGARLAEIATSVAESTIGAGTDPSSLLLDGLVKLLREGYSAGAPILRRAVASFMARELPIEQELRWTWLAGHAAGLTWDYVSWRTLSARFGEISRETGSLGLLPIALSTRAACHLFAGELAQAAEISGEIDVVTEATRSRIAPYGALGLMAFRGEDVAGATRQADAARQDAYSRGEGVALTFVQWASALLLNGCGRYRQALAAAKQAAEDLPVERFRNWGLAELVESAVRCEEPGLASEALEQLSRTTRSSESDWGLGVEARCRALVSLGEPAEPFYREAIERLQRTPVGTDLARSHLLYGEWLRRVRRRADARKELRLARDAFAGFGMCGFASRAAAELRATGERARRRAPETREDLTPQELQVARLVASGATNAEVASRLFISANTVDYHLRKVFRKLGLRSRTQLARHVLAAGLDTESARG